jgi:hypothetical protein
VLDRAELRHSVPLQCGYTGDAWRAHYWPVRTSRSLSEQAVFTALLLLLVVLWWVFPHASTDPECRIQTVLRQWVAR